MYQCLLHKLRDCFCTLEFRLQRKCIKILSDEMDQYTLVCIYACIFQAASDQFNSSRDYSIDGFIEAWKYMRQISRLHLSKEFLSRSTCTHISPLAHSSFRIRVLYGDTSSTKSIHDFSIHQHTVCAICLYTPRK